MSIEQEKLKQLTSLVRYYILKSTTTAGSGHPSSSLSAVELMTALMFGGFFSFDVDNPKADNNDRLIFSKGHAAPLLYSLWTVAGKVSEEELMTLRKFGSPLEGHPTMAFSYTEAATGSLGQGLSIGVGMALNAKLDQLDYRTYVLLGDSEMAEGSVWEALALATHYKLDNLVGIVDVNRLGQRGETMYGHDVGQYQKRISAFGWETIVVDGHDLSGVIQAFESAGKVKDKPTMIIAKTLKGKGVSFIEDKDGWHGRALDDDQLKQALDEIGEVDKTVRGDIAAPKILNSKSEILNKSQTIDYKVGESLATRKAYGNALVRIFAKFPNMVVLDAETSNSTFAEKFKEVCPERFIECFIAEQNMVGMALGLSRRGKIPFVSTFAAFLSRAFDQIRMSQYSDANIKFIGSHAGVSIGVDGSSQMALEDLAMFRTIMNCVVLYPSDAVSCDKLVELAAEHQGNVYIRTTRADTSVIYNSDEIFEIGGSKTVKSSDHDQITVIGAGITLHEALAAAEDLSKENINVKVIDLYSIKPIDEVAIKKAAAETKAIITVEDHFPEGGLGEAVKSVLSSSPTPVISLAVRKMPKSGQPQELLDYEEINSQAIVKSVKKILKK